MDEAGLKVGISHPVLPTPRLEIDSRQAKASETSRGGLHRGPYAGLADKDTSMRSDLG